MLPREAIYLESIGRSLLSHLTENPGSTSQRIMELTEKLRTMAPCERGVLAGAAKPKTARRLTGQEIANEAGLFTVGDAVKRRVGI